MASLDHQQNPQEVKSQMNQDEMIVRIPMTWPVALRQDIEERFERAAFAEKLLITEVGTYFRDGKQERWLFFGRKNAG